MSTLTKILIVLLSLFTIFLCGTVVTYVSTAKNYKTAYENTKKELMALKQSNREYKKQLEEKKLAMETLNDKLDKKIAAITSERNLLRDNLKNAERSKIALDEKVQNLASAALKFEQTVGGMEQSLKATRAELDQARADGIKLSKNLNEITASLEQKMAQLKTLEDERKRLLEEKANMEKEMTSDSTSNVVFEPVTQIQDRANQAIAPAQNVSIDGVITAVEGTMATISVGSADGVSRGMVFHVVSNDGFLCDIKITDVDTEVSAGTLQLVQKMPAVGDTASTSW